jgi:hypothetical protein
MIIEYGIQVVDEEGNPVSGAEVMVHYPWAADSGSTDEGGWVRFEKSQAFGDAAHAAIYVNGELQADGVWIQNRAEFVFESGNRNENAPG